MAQIKINKLTFAYDGRGENVFDNVSFSFDSNWKIGLIGRNGRGKTTLLKLLLGELDDRGSITGNKNLVYFPCKVNSPEMYGIELIEEICPDCQQWQVEKKLNELDFNVEDLYKPFCNLSNGQQTKFLLALLFAKEDVFLLIDEPTNHLDLYGREQVSEFLSKQRNGYIIVSHDRSFIDGCVDHIISINKSDIEVQKGNFSSWQENKNRSDEFELFQNEKIKKDITRLQESAKEVKVWADRVEKTKNHTRNSGVKLDKGYVGHQSARMMKKSKVLEGRIERAIEEKSKLLKNIEHNDEIFLNFKNSTKDNLLQVKNISFYYGAKEVFKDLSFSVSKGDKIAVFGKNGCGKSTLFKVLIGEKEVSSGEIYKYCNLKISYISQNFDFLKGSIVNFAKENFKDEYKFFTMLIKLGFTRDEFDKNMEAMSSGQKKKVLIAKSLYEECNIYIWDEPLNFIDVISRRQIEELVQKSDITMLFVEHDKTFVENVATKIIEL